MGQAKQRGTFEQRQSAAYEAVHAGIEVRKRELEEMEALERRQLDAMGNFLTTRVLPQMDRQYGALMRADFSQIELRIAENLNAESKGD